MVLYAVYDYKALALHKGPFLNDLYMLVEVSRMIFSHCFVGVIRVFAHEYACSQMLLDYVVIHGVRTVTLTFLSM